MPTEKKTLLSVEELAERWGISPRTIYNSTHRKSDRAFPLRPVRIGRAVRFRLVDVEAVEASQEGR